MSDQIQPLPMPPPTFRTGPECGNPPEMCRITIVSIVQEPIVEWVPEYDGHGTMINGDPNTHTRTTVCSVCSGEWLDTTAPGAETVRTVVKDPAKL